MKLRITIPMAVAMVLGACSIQESDFSTRFNMDPELSGGSYTSGGGITVAAEFQERDGRTAVCGVWAESRRQSVLTKNAVRDLLPSASVYMGKERLVQNLMYMREIEPVADYSTQEVNCAISDRPWQAGDENLKPVIRIPRAMVYRDDGEFGGGFAVYFYQTGPGAGE